MSSLIQKIKKISLEDWTSFFLLLAAFVPALIMRIREKHIWCIVERVDSADDNGWYFYQWIKKHHPERHVYFLLGKNAEQFDINDKTMIAWRSFRHYIIYLASDIHIKTIFMSPTPSRVCSYFEKFCRKNLKTIYLRHGISKDGVEMHCYSYLKVRLFICGAEPEYNFFLEKGGYPNGYLAYTGLARFDDLLDRCRNDRYVLLLPTWRRYLVDNSLSQEENEKRIKDSDYFKHYQSLISNSSLIDFLESNSLKLIVCLHPEFSRFKSLFNNISKSIIIKNNAEISIHHLLKNTCLLITDYSSVFFDAAYMHKPIIYYHFDYDEFRKKHLSEGYFSYDKDGMGIIVRDESELLRQIEMLYNGETFDNPIEYIHRCDTFFTKRDKKNNERIYKEIVKVESE